MTLRTRLVRPDDAPRMLALNTPAVPAVNLLDADELAGILAVAHAGFAVVDDAGATGDAPAAGPTGSAVAAAAPAAAPTGSAAAAAGPAAAAVPLLGFVLTLLPGAAYESENYRWFSARSNDFLYVDRIVVADGARDRGIGAMLYAAVFEAARAAGVAEVFCEVNLEPPNPGSLRFHHRLGFEEVGQQATKGGSVVVSLLAARV
ncbi:GNAT family N-acetyltransferase [Subtercola sp. YIM 133946]|uniref:GNAT family N-acetyltransferase n=1 Tax=Subtercola sp. YIM 133946 TaxID=3118909 RepID=UPI002F927C36